MAAPPQYQTTGQVSPVSPAQPQQVVYQQQPQVVYQQQPMQGQPQVVYAQQPMQQTTVVQMPPSEGTGTGQAATGTTTTVVVNQTVPAALPARVRSSMFSMP